MSHFQGLCQQITQKDEDDTKDYNTILTISDLHQRVKSAVDTVGARNQILIYCVMKYH